MSFPSASMTDVERFERQLSYALDTGTPQEIVEGVRLACQLIERMAEDADLNMDKINNATSACIRSTARLAKRLKEK